MTLLEKLEGMEIRELMPPELNDLKNILNNDKVDYIYKPDPRTHSGPYLELQSINPTRSPGGIVIVVLGNKGWSEHYPLLYFSGKTLIGFFSVHFTPYAWDDIQDEPYQKHKKIKFHIRDDKIYIFPPFRGNINLGGKLLTHLEDTLRKYGYGNIELKPDAIFHKYLRSKGYSSQYGTRWGKLL